MDTIYAAMEALTKYVRTQDGVNIAYWAYGEGFPLVIVPSPLFSNFQAEWRISEYREWYEGLAEGRMLAGYDSRGSGLSDHRIDDFSLEAQLRDLETVVEELRLDRFDLLGVFHSGPVATAYAVRHPTQVRRLVLWGSYALAADYSAIPRVQALRALLAKDWDAFVETVGVFSFGYTDPERIELTKRFLKESATQEGALAAIAAIDQFDVRDILRDVALPVLVLHRRKLVWPTLEVAQHLASNIPGARMQVIDGEIQMPWGDDVVRAIRSFLDESDPVGRKEAAAQNGTAAEGLTAREGEVLRLVAQGQSNKEIASDLSLSVHTVERHLANIYAKIGARGRADAISYALKHGLA